MKITGIDTFVVDAGWRPWQYVAVRTDEGITGYGECSDGRNPYGVVETAKEFEVILLGQDPRAVEARYWDMYRMGRQSPGGIAAKAIAGIDLALWDIKGKALGVPVYELLGGPMRDKIWTYGRWDGASPEECVEHALREVATGLTALKGDPFGHQGLFSSAQSERDAVAKLKAVREAVGDDIELLVEVHGRLAPSAAIRVGLAIEEYRPYVFEEPVPPQNIDAMKRVADAINVPLATGERLYTKWGFTDLLEQQVVAMIQPDIGHAGGILELKKIAAMAEAYYVGFQPHNPYGPVNSIAALQVDACTPNFMIQEGGHGSWFDMVVVGGEFPKQKDGFFDLPTAPGIGIEIDESVLRANPPIAQVTPEGYSRAAYWTSMQQTEWA